MHDIRAIRADPAAFDAAMVRRGLPPASPEIIALDTERRAVLTALQEKQARRIRCVWRCSAISPTAISPARR